MRFDESHRIKGTTLYEFLPAHRLLGQIEARRFLKQ
jgi:hypothetical protein